MLQDNPPEIERSETPLGLEHQALLSPLLHRFGACSGSGLSEYCFSNLLLFREQHQYRVARFRILHPTTKQESEILYGILGTTYDGQAHLLPLFDMRTYSVELLKALLPAQHCFYPIPAELCTELLAKPGSPHFDAEARASDADYLYPLAQLASLAGNKLGKKRNQLKQFMALGAISHEAITAHNQSEALAVLDQWLIDGAYQADQVDYQACIEALELLQPLGLHGSLFRVNQQPAGFLISGAINEQTTAMHFAKGLRRFPGVFPYMFNSWARDVEHRLHQQQHQQERPPCQWVNFEQDLGKPGFRRNKRSYAPAALLEKYRVRLL